MKKSKYSTASHIGQAAFCPHSLYLQQNKNTVYDKTTIQKREKGINDHNHLNRQVMAGAKSNWLPKFAIVLLILVIMGGLLWLR